MPARSADQQRTLVWFRGKDLRLADHAPLRDALGTGEVVLLFVLDPYFFAPRRAQQLPHRIQFLLESLGELQQKIADRGSTLIIAKGKSVEVIPRLVRRWRINRVVAHRWCEPVGRKRDLRIGAALTVPFDLFEGETLVPPGSLRTKGGRPYSVFTPFSRAFAGAIRVAKPLPAPGRLPPPPADVRFRQTPIPTCEQLGLARNPNILSGGEKAARLRMKHFFDGAARHYHVRRDRMDLESTSRLSADIKFGTLSIRTVWNEAGPVLGSSEAGRLFRNELVWREFTHSTLWDRPELLDEPFRAGFKDFPYINDDELWSAWVEGRTGYPVVDASARQLLTEGFVHNRARMISASFLTKHLLLDYRRGEAHYLTYLTDGDWAQNNFGWQWSAGCGCDAQPYFRVFNPVTQGERYDPDGEYVRRWVPELAGMPAKYIHRPREAPDRVLDEAGVVLNESYPEPIVEHRMARERFLDIAGRQVKKKSR